MLVTLSYRSITRRATAAAALLTLLLLYATAPARASVEITSFSATGNSSGVRINWSTASEIDHLGYNVFRTTVSTVDFGDVPVAQRVQINPLLIASEGGTTGATYTVTDDTAEDGVTYYYWLEMIDMAGERTYAGPAEARRGSGSLIGGGATPTATVPPTATPAATATTTGAPTATPDQPPAAATATPVTPTTTPGTAATATPTPVATPLPTADADTPAPVATDTGPASATSVAPAPAQPLAPATPLPTPANSAITQEAALAIDVAGENSAALPAVGGATSPDAAAASAEAPASAAPAPLDSSDVSPTAAVAAAPIGGDSGQPSDVARSGTSTQQDGLAALWLWIGLAVSAMFVVAGAGALLIWLRRQP